MSYTESEIAAAAAVQDCINRITSIPNRMPYIDEAGYPGPGYRAATAPHRAVEHAILDALGVSDKRASDVRHEIAFEFKGTREERVAVMGEAWVLNQEERGLVPR